MIEVTACLVSWRRQYHLPIIIEHLRQFPEIKEVIVWQNEEMPSQELLKSDARIIYSKENRCVYGRFLAAMKAKTEYVFTQDDDLLVHNIAELTSRRSLGDSKSIVANLADDNHSRHWNWWMVNNPVHIELGFGSVFRREDCEILKKWKHSEELLNRKADKVFSVLHSWEPVRADGDCLTRLFHGSKESGRDVNALYLREDHERLTGEAIRLAKNWRVEA